jgi:hypothetical protein
MIPCQYSGLSASKSIDSQARKHCSTRHTDMYIECY